MTQSSATQQGSKQDKNAIRPFQVTVPEAELSELRRRINATKWPERETVADASQGVQLATTQALARYWGSDYDWRKCEARLNALPQFITEIDGLDIHFIHVRSKHENASAAHRHARMARLCCRAAENHRSADQSYGTWRRAHQMRSISSFHQCRATDTRASRPLRAGVRITSRAPGSC